MLFLLIYRYFYAFSHFSFCWMMIFVYLDVMLPMLYANDGCVAFEMFFSFLLFCLWALSLGWNFISKMIFIMSLFRMGSNSFFGDELAIKYMRKLPLYRRKSWQPKMLHDSLGSFVSKEFWFASAVQLFSYFKSTFAVLSWQAQKIFN